MKGHYGTYGGQFVPETLMHPLEELEAAYAEASKDPGFHAQLDELFRNYSGRPTPLYFAERLTRTWNSPKIYLKREDLNHTGAHKINNCLGQGLLAVRMGKKRIIAETGAGQHGVATATVCARLGLECDVYMGEEDIRRQELNVFRMKLLGAKVVPVSSGSKTLKDAINESMRDWVTNVRTTYYMLGSVLGPHPYPQMVRDFQSVIGREVRAQIIEREGRLPDLLIACVGGGSNSIGLFYDFIDDSQVQMIGVEAGGRGPKLGDHAARFSGGKPGILHGTYSYILQDEDGQIVPTHSVSAGLDYPSVGPEHARLHDAERVTYTSINDNEALDAFGELSHLEGIIPALESSHAVAQAKKVKLPKDKIVVVNLSGRGDKDVNEVARLREIMTRIDKRFELLRKEGRKAFIPYITAGDPNLETTRDLVFALEKAGADIVELGVPFSDPIADGPVIQRGTERALRNRVGLTKVLKLAAEIRTQSQIPLLLFSYYNPLFNYGLSRLAEDCVKSGIDGILATDLTVEESDEFVQVVRGAGLNTVFLVAPTSSAERMKKIALSSTGFLYAVSRTGVTGERQQLDTELHGFLHTLRGFTTAPIAVGFGISQPEHVRAVWQQADGAVVGSAIVREIEQHIGQPDLVERVAAFARWLSHPE